MWNPLNEVWLKFPSSWTTSIMSWGWWSKIPRGLVTPGLTWLAVGLWVFRKRPFLSSAPWSFWLEKWGIEPGTVFMQLTYLLTYLAYCYITPTISTAVWYSRELPVILHCCRDWGWRVTQDLCFLLEMLPWGRQRVMPSGCVNNYWLKLCQLVQLAADSSNICKMYEGTKTALEELDVHKMITSFHENMSGTSSVMVHPWMFSL